MIIRPANNQDAKMYWEHSCRHEQESGRGGDSVFSPFESVKQRSLEEFSNSQLESWNKELTSPGWERTWFLTDEKEIFGDLELGQRPAIESAIHRATLTMGIERNYRGKGYGTKLMEAAIGWARMQPALDWLQLCVFENNAQAKALYKRFGFVEVGTTPDMFRVFGERVADTSMILKLR